MNRHLTVGAVGVVAALLAGVLGYAAGFRKGWELSLYADAAPRGSLALALLQRLDSDRADDVKLQLESDIDSGLVWWAHLERSPVFPLVNVLSGYDVVPDHEQYLRRLAAHRVSNASPLLDPAAHQRILENVNDPAVAADMEAGYKQSRSDIERMVARYGR